MYAFTFGSRHSSSVRSTTGSTILERAVACVLSPIVLIVSKQGMTWRELSYMISSE